MKWLTIASEKDDTDAESLLGMMFLNGWGVSPSAKEGVDLLKKAAKESPVAQCNLGALYFEGKLVNQSYQEAAKWFEKSANQGLAAGQYSLGFLYDLGKGFSQSKSIARRYYQLAANQGFEPAIEALKNL